MDSNSRRQMGRNRAFSLLNASIEALDLAKEVSAIVPAKTIFGSVSTLLTIIKVCFPPPTKMNFGLTMRTGLDGQGTGLRRARVGLRQYL